MSGEKDNKRSDTFKPFTADWIFAVSFKSLNLHYTIIIKTSHKNYPSQSIKWPVYTEMKWFQSLTPMSDQDRISPYNIKQTSYESKEKYKLGDY